MSTTERVDIVINSTGDQQAANNLQRIGKAATEAGQHVETLNSGLDFLKSSLAAIGFAFTINETIKLTDTYTSLINRLRLTSSSAQELINTEQALFDVSQRTRGSFEETAKLYSKLAIQANAIGIEQKELIPIVETINKAIAVSGANATEAKNGLIQFSQGLAAGRLQGQDLRAVLEDIPFLGQQIAKGLGTTIAGLRILGEQGQLSAKAVLDALNKQAPEIARAFATMTPTIAQAFQILQNNVLRFVGQANQASFTSKLLATTIIFLGEHVGEIITTIGLATSAFLAWRASMLIVSVIQGVAAAVAFLNISMLPLLATVTAVAVAITGLVLLWQKFGPANDDIGLSVNKLGTAFLGLGKNASDVASTVDGSYKAILARQKEFDKEDDEFFKQREEAVKKWRDENEKQIEAYNKDLDDLIKKEQDAAKVTRNAYGDMIEVTSEWARRSGEYFNAVKAGQDGFNSSSTKMATDAETNFGRITKAANSAKAAIDSFTSSSSVGPDVGEARRALGQFGLANTDQLFQAIGTSDSLYGTPLGGKALQDLVPLLKAIQSTNPNAFNYLKSNFGYLFDRITTGGYGQFANGGDFIVGGSGGTDSQLVQFMATPGEKVRVTTQNQSRGGDRPIVVQMSVYTNDANSFRRSQSQVLMELQGKLNQVKGRLGG